MKKIILFLRNSHEHIFNAVAAIISIAIVVYLFPKDAKFQYEFQKGKPWLHEDLFAPFDFAIHKSQEELSNEQKITIEGAKPFFKIHSPAQETLLKNYTENFEKTWQERNPEFQKQKLFTIGNNIIHDIYKKGILKIDDVIENMPPDYSILVSDDNISEERELHEIFTIQTAYRHTDSLLTINLHNENEKMFLLPLIENALIHTIFYDKETSEKILQENLNNVSLTKGKIEKDVAVISKGEIVTGEKFQTILSLKQEYEKQTGGSGNYFTVMAGQGIVVFIIVFLLMTFLFLFRKDIINESNKVLFILILLLLMVFMAMLALKIKEINIYALPFCILPILLRTFYDTRLATFTHTLTIVLIGFIAPNGFEFVFIELIAGIAAIFSIATLYNRSQLFTTSFIVFVAYSLSYFGITIFRQAQWNGMEWFNFIWFAASAMLTLFAYPMMYAFEKLFGFLSDVSLIELSNTNTPLLRNLAENAPGTFQHSLQVANLAEEVIHHIGGNPLLVRTGALYHDIGKIENPVFFSENQQEVNPHHQLPYEESARIIIKHVILGIEMARKEKLPEQIIDFIRTHHGTSKARFFLENYRKEHSDEIMDESKFQYAGPVPFSKEGAVLMMADSVEAASRSLKHPTAESLGTLVDNIIAGQIAENQFVNSNITFKDISEIKKVLKRKLLSIYHARIEYPHNHANTQIQE